MLYCLKNINDGTVFYLTGKDTFLLGRKNCDIVIQNDQSISRKHAIVRIKENTVTVEDCKSKYSTLHKDKKIQPNIETELKVGDTIQFGVYTSVFRLEKYECVTTGTRLQGDVKSKLIKDLASIKGKYVEQWTSECTHLTIEEVTVTVKFLQALLDEKPIVRPIYWAKFAERVQKNLPPPDIQLQSNRPRITDKLLNKFDLKPNPERKTLFCGKIFVFQTENSRKLLADVIKKSGGASISWEKNPITLEDVKSSSNQYVIVQSPHLANHPDLNKVITEYTKQGKRTIPFEEVGIAIVLCSCEKNCNPNFNRIKQVFKTDESKDASQSMALAADTESNYFTGSECKTEPKLEAFATIPDTYEEKISFGESQLYKHRGAGCDNNEQQSVKRLSDTLEDCSTRSKKSKTDKSDAVSKTNEEKDGKFLAKVTERKSNVENIEAETNPFVKIFKRNRNESPQPSSSTGNPFKRIKTETIETRSETNSDNPFKLSLGSKKRGCEGVALESTSKKKKNGSIEEKVFSNITHKANAADYFETSKRNKTEMNCTWLSKSLPRDVKEHLSDYFSEEMKKFIEQFKNAVIVENVKSPPIKSKILKDDVDGVQSSKVNFKKFKKVKPLRPQTTVIPRTSLCAVTLGDTAGIVDSRREIFVSDDEAEAVTKFKKKAPKKFII